jgi:hypothetical protein
VIGPDLSTGRFELVAPAHTWCGALRALVRDFDASCHWDIGMKVGDEWLHFASRRYGVLGATNS